MALSIVVGSMILGTRPAGGPGRLRRPRSLGTFGAPVCRRPGGPVPLTLAGDWLADPDAWWKDANTVPEIGSHRYHLLPDLAERTMSRH